MTTQEKIAVMQAFDDGKSIQERWLHDPEWVDLKKGDYPDWHWGKRFWRIKPEPKQPVLREWEPEEVPLDAWFRDADDAFKITAIDPDECIFEIDGSWFSTGELLKKYKHSFTPFDPNSWKECGVQE